MFSWFIWQKQKNGDWMYIKSYEINLKDKVFGNSISKPLLNDEVDLLISVPTPPLGFLVIGRKYIQYYKFERNVRIIITSGKKCKFFCLVCASISTAPPISNSLVLYSWTMLAYHPQFVSCALLVNYEGLH